MSNPDLKPHILRVQVLDKKDGEVLKVDTDLVSLPDHPQFKSEKFHGLLDALGAFAEANPGITKIEVQVIGKDQT